MTKPWSGIELKPRPARGAVALPGADGLFYEGPVGAGSIVVSAVQLGERDLVNWPGFDGFLNGALLRRPRARVPRRARRRVDGPADPMGRVRRTAPTTPTSPRRCGGSPATPARRPTPATVAVDCRRAATPRRSIRLGGGYAIPED